ncbi:MAG: hypothetical protein IKV81_06665 [Clostridia bacterium]|nr:hypothetical protein [Clostridia bacterium]
MLKLEELNSIRAYGAFCELPSDIKINGVELDYNDFGVKGDTEPEAAKEYCCGNMQFTPFPFVVEETLKKYDITIDEYAAIQEKLDCLSFGSCGWCS